MTNDLACFKHDSSTSPTHTSSTLYRVIVAFGALMFFVEGATSLTPFSEAEARVKKEENVLDLDRPRGNCLTKKEISVRVRDTGSFSEDGEVVNGGSRRHHPLRSNNKEKQTLGLE